MCPDKKRVFTDPFCGVRGVDFRENLLQVFHNKLIFERDRVSVDICPLFFEYLWYFFFVSFDVDDMVLCFHYSLWGWTF